MSSRALDEVNDDVERLTLVPMTTCACFSYASPSSKSTTTPTTLMTRQEPESMLETIAAMFEKRLDRREAC